MGHCSEASLPPVVGFDVELDEATRGSKAVQRVKVEPSVLQGSPERLDHRIGRCDFDLSQDTRQFLAIEQIIDSSVHVLASRVRHHDCMIGATVELNDRFAQDVTRSAAAEPFLESPRQDPPGVVVDHRMKIRSRAIEQPDDRHVQMKEFAGGLGSDPDLGFGRVDAFPWAPPPRIDRMLLRCRGPMRTPEHSQIAADLRAS